MAPQLISGNINNLDPNELRATLKDSGITRLDTAARYANGESEKMLGKANPAWDGSLTTEKIEKSLLNSLDVLGVEKVNVLYCHGPDKTTPIGEQARAFHKHYEKGRFTHLGVSNFSTSMLEEWLSISEKENLVKPSVFQGQYNLLCREYEQGLFPLLRKHNIAFNAFSPLAGGFLVGNYAAEGAKPGSRYSNPAAAIYVKWYDKPSMHEAIKKLRVVSENTGLGMDELSVRWLAHHSALEDQDGIILGGSKISHISRNVAQIRQGRLDVNVAKELGDLWESVQEDGKQIIEY